MLFDLMFWGVVGLLALAWAVSTVVFVMACWLYFTGRNDA